MSSADGDGVNDFIDGVDNTIGKLWRGTGSGGGLDKSLRDHKAKEYTAHRNAILADKELDTASRDALLKNLDASFSGESITDTSDLVAKAQADLQAAKGATGVYGVYRKNAELVKLMNDKPGRQQTILTQGAKAVSGTESTGLLTGLVK